MIKTDHKGTEVRNTKTGSLGVVRCEFQNTKTKRLVVEVQAFGRVAYWDLSNVEFPG